MTGTSEGSPPVLVVDDDDDIRETIESVLQMYGWPVTTVSSGDAALDWLHSNPKPALILLDLMMPGMDGFELREHQLGDPALATIPIVVLTGGSLTAVDRGRLGDVEILSKPVTVPALLGCLDRHRTPSG